MKRVCIICGVGLTKFHGKSRTCVHCDAFIEKGYTDKEIKEYLETLNKKEDNK